MDLKTISLNNLSAILQGSVFIRNNPWLNSFAHRILWNNITHWNNGPHITHMNIIQQVQSPVEMCNDSCRPEGALVGYCWSRDVCQTVCEPSSSPLSCTASGKPCPEECIGGCYKTKNVTKCYACKHFRNLDGCTESCFPNYSLDNYRCVTDNECVELGRKLLSFQNSTFKCVEECPESYKTDVSNSSLCSLCSDCKKTCEGSIVDSVEKAQKLSGCEIINGSLEIRVYGKRILQDLSKHLGKIQEVDGYVYIHHSRELKSLKFLGNLTKINGKETWQTNYSLIVHDNDDLEDLWNTTNTRLKIANGHPLFYANPQLCTHSIVDLVGDSDWKASIPDDNIRSVLNGNKRACNIHKNFDFKIEPLYEKGVLHITVTSGLVPKPNLVGFYVYYKETKKDILKYYGTDWHWKREFQPVPGWEIKLKLKPATRYAIFLESKTTDQLHNFQSVIKYSVTKPFNPSPPENVRVSSSNLDFAEVSWDPPQFPNGEIDHYVISFQPIMFENYDNVDMCNSDERKKYMEYYNNEKETQKQIAEEEEKEKNESQSLTSNSQPKVNDVPCSSEDSYVDETVDRKREGINMAVKLSELIYASSSDPHKVRKRRRRRRRKRDTNFKLVEQICNQIEGQAKRSVPRGLGRNLDTVSKGSAVQPLIIERTLIENLQNSDPDVVSQLQEELSELSQINHPNISQNCTVYLIKLIQQIIENTRNKTEPNRKDFENDIDQPIFLSISNSTSMADRIIYGTRYNIENLTSSSYEFRIMACQKEINSTNVCGKGRNPPPCKLCSQWYKTRIKILLDKEHYQSDIKIIGVDNNNNNVSVSWSPPKYLPMNEILYYTIYVQQIGNSSSARKNLHTFCESPSSNRSFFFIPKLGNYSVQVATFSIFNDELPRSSPASFVITKNYAPNITNGSHDQISNTNGVFVTLISVTIFVLLSFVAFCFFRPIKGSKLNLEKKLDFLGAQKSTNPSYESYPPWKEYLVKKIDEKDLYSPSDLYIEELKVGEGFFGVVHKGILKSSEGESSKVAVKKLRADANGSSQSYKELINEASLMLQIKCFHLVEMYGVAFTKEDLFLVMEYMENKSLDKYINDNVTDGDIFHLFSREKLLQIAIQVADGMAYLAFKKILHMDLATRNILLDGHENAKISDFGMSRIVEGDFYSIRKNKPVPIRWMPPEYFKSNKFTTHSDVWSYGVLLWEIMNPGKVPYGHKTEKEDIKLELINNVLPGSISSKAPFREIMKECWEICPEQRPKFYKIVLELHAKLVDETFKYTFEKKSFSFSVECPKNIDCTDVIEIDEPDDTPSTPLTNTPSQSNSHFLRKKYVNEKLWVNENMDSFRDRTSLRNLHKQLSSLQTSFSKPLSFVNNFRESLASSPNKLSEVKNKEENAVIHIPKETSESQEDFAPIQLKCTSIIKNGNGIVQM